MSLKNVSFIVLNGSRKGIYDFIKKNIEKLCTIQCTIRTNTTEEELYNLKKNYPNTVSYYFSETLKIKNQRIYDVECPNMSLYDDYIQVGSRTNSKQ